MEMMMTTRSTVLMDDSSSSTATWKFYDNPHYNSQRQHKQSSRSSYHARDVRLSDLDNALAEIKELRAELQFERRMRRKAQAFNRALTWELDEERGRREAADTAGAREVAGREMKEVEGERLMLRMAEKIQEMMPAESKLKVDEEISNRAVAVQRREVENPHVKRGMKGLEFPRAVRARSPGMGSSPSSKDGRGGGGAGHLGSNLECQRAQLKVLMRHKNPAGSGIIGAAENLAV